MSLEEGKDNKGWNKGHFHGQWGLGCTLLRSRQNAFENHPPENGEEGIHPWDPLGTTQPHCASTVPAPD